jgi:hypothetical protein
VYALVNVQVDALTQLATTYSPDEIAFVKRILDYMFDTNNTKICEGMVVTPIQATQLAKVSSADTNRRRSTNAETQQNQGGAAQSLTMTQAETMMQNLMAEGWLEKSPRNYFSLTPRALMELRSWLADTYNYVNDNGQEVKRIKFCAACRDIVTVVSIARVVGYLSTPADSICRANVAATVIALADFTITACATFSVCSRLRSAPSAKRIGLGISSWVRGL